jgi:hypothetical protein
VTLFWPPALHVDVTSDRRERVQEVRTTEGTLIAFGAAVDIPLLIGTNDSMAVHDGIVVVPHASTTDFASRVPNNVTVPDAARLLGAIRMSTGLPWTTVARMLGVDRRTLYFWLEGRRISIENRRQLDALAAHVARLDRGSPSVTAAAVLDSWPSVHTPVEVDRLAGLRVTEADPAARLPRLSVATLLTRGDDALPPTIDPGRRPR